MGIEEINDERVDLENKLLKFLALGMIMEIIVMYPIQHCSYRDEIDNLLVFLIGGILIAMPILLSVTMAIGSHRLSTQGAITKRMTTIEEKTGMDVLCSDKTGTLTLNKLKVDKAMIKDMDLAARASRVENQDAIHTCIVGMLADPKEGNLGALHWVAGGTPIEETEAGATLEEYDHWFLIQGMSRVIDKRFMGATNFYVDLAPRRSPAWERHQIRQDAEIERLRRQSAEGAESSKAAKLRATGVPPEPRVPDYAVERLSRRLARAERKLKKKDHRMRQQVAAMEVLRGDMSRLQAERDAAMTTEALLREQLAQQPVVSDVAVEAVLEEEEITPEPVPVVVADAATTTNPSLDEQARLQADLNFREVEVYVLHTYLAESLQYGQRAAAEIQALIAQLATVGDHAIVMERDAQRDIISDLRSQLGRSQSTVADLENRATTDAMMVDLRFKLYESETKEQYSQMLAEQRDAAAELRSRISHLEGELTGQYAYFESRSRFLSQRRTASTRGSRQRCRELVPPFFEADPFSSVPASAVATPADALGAVNLAASDGSSLPAKHFVETATTRPKRQKTGDAPVEGSGETGDAPSPKRQKT